MRITVSELSKRVDKIEIDMNKMKQTLEEVHGDTHKIVSILEGAKGTAFFVKKHAPRIVAFILGILVTTGYIEADTLKQFKVIFPH